MITSSQLLFIALGLLLGSNVVIHVTLKRLIQQNIEVSRNLRMLNDHIRLVHELDEMTELAKLVKKSIEDERNKTL